MRAAAVGLVVLAAACMPGGDLDGSVIPEASVTEFASDAGQATLASPVVVDVGCPSAEVVEPAAADPDDGVSCGVVILPEDRADPAGPVVEVAFLRLAARPLPDVVADPVPLIVLADGPGDPSTAEVAAWVDSPLRGERDIILLDDRGAGLSFPSLDCGVPPAPGDLPLDLVQDCRRDLVAGGVNLMAYNTAAFAADVRDVIAALEIEDVALLGVGHGARVALEVLRADPTGLRALVLDSPAPPEVDVIGQRPAAAQAALNRLFDECVQTPACDRSFGDLRRLLDLLITRLNAQAARPESPEEISGDDLVRATLAAMRGADGPALVPAALTLAERAPAEALALLQTAAIAGATVPSSAFSEGLRLSADCHDRVPFLTTEATEDATGPLVQAVAADVVALLAACEIWDVLPADEVADRPVEGDVPTLVLTGEFDPFSPAAWGGAIAARLAHGQVVQVDGAGHRVHDADNCTTAIVAAFLRAPLQRINDACATDRVISFVQL